ncbi:hypothetical protein JW905_00835 [bacterium]|nr:hypothetical protein [candidate division CSSED10-310 bacterium]
MKLNKVCVTGILLLGLWQCLPNVHAEVGPVNIGIGTMRISGLLQTWYNHSEADDSIDKFSIKRSRVKFDGVLLDEHITYCVQLELTKSPCMIDSKLSFDYLPHTRITVGRFLPNFTLYMPTSTAKLDLINRPLSTDMYGMSRQTGLQFQSTFSMFQFTLGAFNGYQGQAKVNADTATITSAFSGDDRGDENDAKDFLFGAEIKPLTGLRCAAYYWLGKPGFSYETLDGVTIQHDYDVTRLGGFIQWRWESLHLAAECITGTEDRYTVTFEDGNLIERMATVDSLGYFAQAAYRVHESFEILARYDGYDPDRDLDDDAQSWITLGVNYDIMPDYRAKIGLNYIFKDEEGESVNNDELLLQLQLAF